MTDRSIVVLAIMIVAIVGAIVCAILTEKRDSKKREKLKAQKELLQGELIGKELIFKDTYANAEMTAFVTGIDHFGEGNTVFVQVEAKIPTHRGNFRIADGYPKKSDRLLDVRWTAEEVGGSFEEWIFMSESFTHVSQDGTKWVVIPYFSRVRGA